MKKKSAAWYIAATHYITAGFLIPTVAFFAVVYAMANVGMDVRSVPVQIGINVIWLVAVWFGVMYSANYLARTYDITDAHKITVLSTVYRIVFVTLFIGGQFLVSTGNTPTEIDMTMMILQVVFAILGTAVFYVASKKYIKQDTSVS
jgi:hypothetical protein